jgi:hypothetical protein
MNKLKTLTAHRLPIHVHLHGMSVDKASSTWRLTRDGRWLNSPPDTVHDFIPTYC